MKFLKYLTSAVLPKAIIPTALIFALQSGVCFAGEKISQSLSAKDVSTVNIEIRRGDITIIGEDTELVSVNGELEEKPKDFIFEQIGSLINIKILDDQRNRYNWGQRDSTLAIKVPTHMKVTFAGVSADVSIQNLMGNTEVKNVNGNIIAKSLFKHIELSTVNGDIKSKNLSGKITLSTVSGNIEDAGSQGRLTLKAVSGEVDVKSSATEVFANSVSGEITLVLSKVDELVASTVSGDIQSQLTLNNSGLIKMSSVSGDVGMQFNDDIEASFRLNSHASGDLVNKITSHKAKQAKYGPSSELHFETGNANGSVRASTVSGTIKVSKY